MVAKNQVVVAIDIPEPRQPLLGHCLPFRSGQVGCYSVKKARKLNEPFHYSTYLMFLIQKEQLLITEVINHLKVNKL